MSEAGSQDCRRLANQMLHFLSRGHGYDAGNTLSRVNRDFQHNTVFAALWTARDMFKKLCRTPHLHLAVVLIALPGLSRGGDNPTGPSMLIVAAQDAAHADALIGECKYDEAEHWIKEAARLAKETRSDNALERDVAGSALGQMTIKLDEFKRQRKEWDRAASDAQHLLASNHLTLARQRVDQAAAPACDSRFTELRSQITSQSQRVTDLVRRGDDQARHYPGTARDFYLQAAAIDSDRPDLQQKLLDVDRRIPGYCSGCMSQR